VQRGKLDFVKTRIFPFLKPICVAVALASVPPYASNAESDQPAGPNLFGEGNFLRDSTSWIISRDVGWSLEEGASPSGEDVLTYERDDNTYALAHTPAVAVIGGLRYGFRALVRGELDSGMQTSAVNAVIARLFYSETSKGDPLADTITSINAPVIFESDDWVEVSGEFVPDEDCYARILFTLPRGLTGKVQFAEPWLWEIRE